MPRNIDIALHFLEPFRVIEWHKRNQRNNRRFLRGYAFARWHGSNEKGRPYITGTLLRSAVLEAAEQLIWLHGGKYQDVPCCNGEFEGSKAKVFRELEGRRMRRRPTLRWKATEVCDPKSKEPCLHCLLLGRCDAANGQETDSAQFDVKFKNLDAPFEGNVALEDLAEARILNRVDQESGKAEDFFKVWEIDPHECGIFHGTISLSARAHDNSALKALLEDSLALVDRLSGALCRIETETAEEGFGDAPGYSSPTGLEQAIGEKAKAIRNAFEKADKAVHLRMFADVFRELRRRKSDEKFPVGHVDRLGKISDHYIWDVAVERKKLRKWIPAAFSDLQKQFSEMDWRSFCQIMGEALYKEAKDASPESFSSERPLGSGASERESDAPDTPLTRITASNSLYEHCIQGKLVARTPFFFGHSDESSSREQTSLRLLTTRDGHLRLPRSVLRGALRRDLTLAMGGGCRAEIGRSAPCPCSVCTLMRKIRVRDSRSEYKNPPEVRHRIRLDPNTATVADGALFDAEVGPPGVAFDFELHLRDSSSELPQELKTVLAWWADEKAFLSGEAGTGKGRFTLKDLNAFQWNIKEGWDDYKSVLGGRKNNPEGGKPIEPQAGTDFPWESQKLEFEVISPFISKDPIATLLNKSGADAVSYQSVEISEDGTEKPRYLLKSESMRGILRAAVARRHPDLSKAEHEDCRCLLCRLFGNEHEAGRVRVEDLLIHQKTEEKLIDRVAIDRFTAGAKDRQKFNLLPLAASPDAPLVFQGTLWRHSDLSLEECEAIEKAISDIRSGLYSFGGLGNVGYGWVPSKTDEGGAGAPAEPLSLAKNFQKPSLGSGHTHWPHYFLPFSDATVTRENTPPSHATLKPELHTGRLVCKLTARTPLIIPDSKDVGPAPNHKEYKIFSLDEKPAIPGSSLRGAISSAFEALTNSCLRIFDEKKRLSWRMKADREVLENFKPGQVIKENGMAKMVEMAEVRYPFYDRGIEKVASIKEYFGWQERLLITQKSLKILEGQGIAKNLIRKIKPIIDQEFQTENDLLLALKERIGPDSVLEHGEAILRSANGFGKVPFYSHPTPTDQRLVKLVNFNRRNANLGSEAYYRIIKNRPKAKPDDRFMFVATPAHNMAVYEGLDFRSSVAGFLKVTGPNKVEKEKADSQGSQGLPPVAEHWGAITHNCEPSIREITVRCGENRDRDCKRRRLVPEYACAAEDPDRPGNHFIYSMTKRCERVFFQLDPYLPKRPISARAMRKYEVLISEYRQNAKQYKTPEAFQTILPENGKLNIGDLVYFRENNGEVVEIIPVRISREIDDEVLGQKLRDDLRPCVREILDEAKAQKVKGEGFKSLFQHHPEGLCPSCALFGTPFYKSRVSFGFARPATGENAPKLLEDGRFLTLPLLERPRPTWSMPRRTEDQVPGRKFYVHHDGWKKVVEADRTPKTENNRSVQAIAPGSEFTFEVRFENLRDEELGLLIYVLGLEEGLAHKMGMAKAFGFGSVDIRVDRVVAENAPDWKTINAEAIKKLKTCWGASSEEELSKKLQNLFQLLFTPEDAPKVRYPSLRKEDDPEKLPGYVELGDQENQFAPTDRQEKLKTPWSPWHTENPTG